VVRLKKGVVNPDLVSGGKREKEKNSLSISLSAITEPMLEQSLATDLANR
jgi:hypothetical protein